MQGTDNWTEWIKNNPEKTSKVLKAFYEDILDKLTSSCYVSDGVEL